MYFPIETRGKSGGERQCLSVQKLGMGQLGCEIILPHFSVIPQLIYTRPKTLGIELWPDYGLWGQKPTEAWSTPAVHHTVSWLRSYEFGQSEECEPSHGPLQAAGRESSLKFRPWEEEWIQGALLYDERWTWHIWTAREVSSSLKSCGNSCAISCCLRGVQSYTVKLVSAIVQLLSQTLERLSGTWQASWPYLC